MKEVIILKKIEYIFNEKQLYRYGLTDFIINNEKEELIRNVQNIFPIPDMQRIIDIQIEQNRENVVTEQDLEMVASNIKNLIEFKFIIYYI